MILKPPQMPETRSQYFPLAGGLDVESAQQSRRPGLLTAGFNYEGAPETGYERVGGFERFDGRARPSDAIFSILQADAGFTGVSVGDTVTGATSAATAKVILVRSSTQLVTTRQTGAFTIGENIQTSAITRGVFTALASDVSSSEDNTFTALAAADYRASIGAVPGEGALRGIAWLGTVCYAWRNNVGSTAMVIHKSTSTGWSAVTLFKELAFTAGSVTATEGLTVTQGAVSATVKRVVLESGSWGAGTAAGRLIVDGVTGGNFAAGAFTAGITATCSGAETQITLAPSGRLDHVVYNFTGSTDTERIYGADGVNKGFEFDGTVYVPIRTGMATDTPTHCFVHKNHLFFSFRGSAQHSGIGAPYAWVAVLGAAEIATGQDIVGFSGLPGDADTSALLIATTKRTLVLYGSSSSDWKLATFSAYTGAQRWSLQNMGSPVSFDGASIDIVRQSQQFGNFERPPISDRIRRFLRGKTVTASVVDRAKRRMRMFFSDGDAVSISAQGEVLGFIPVAYGKTVNVTCEAIVSGMQRNFFGSDDGYVYEADVGRSFDGEEIVAWAKLAFNFAKSPGVKKRFRWADIEVKPQSAMTLRVQAEYSLGDIDIPLTDVYSKAVRGQGAQWDVSNWDESYYDTAVQAAMRIRMEGVGTSVSMTFYSASDEELPHELQSCTHYFSPRRMDRG
ncbi:MAG: hypothetical protein LCH79_15190 [Proteobacteria bacterium]|nr:hypothetical protein [Pseudomonadota bacterium]